MPGKTRTFLCAIAFLLVIASSSRASDSLSVSPAHPTTADSIRLDIIIPNWNCCTRYYEDSVASLVSDTMIELLYQYETPVVCPLMACIVGGYSLPYKSGPLAAGTYAVYEFSSQRCTTSCPPIAFIPERIGSFTVTKPTIVAHQLNGIASIASAGPRSMAACYTIRGELITHPAVAGRIRGIAVVAVVEERGPTRSP